MSSSEKDTLPSSNHIQSAPSRSKRSLLLKILVIGSILWIAAIRLLPLLTVVARHCGVWRDELTNAYTEPPCLQVNILQPNKNSEIWESIGKEISTNAFKDSAISWLSGAVQVP